jgi:glutathione S-transferase
MIKLYIRNGCPFCTRVLIAINAIGIPYEMLEVTNFSAAQDLIERGGKMQVPYLVDERTGVSMYESGDIIAYLDHQYAKLK